MAQQEKPYELVAGATQVVLQPDWDGSSHRISEEASIGRLWPFLI